MPIWKTIDEPPASNALKEQIYNLLDCCLTEEVFQVLEKQLDEVTAKVYAFEKALQVPVFSMELQGVKVDTSARDDLVLELSQDVSLLETSLREILTEGIGVSLDNPGSPKQLAYLLYDVLGLPVQKKYKTGGVTVDAKALEKLKQYFYATPIISHIQKIRDLTKQISTLRTSIDHDNRIRTSFNIAGTETGRFNSYASALGSGTNLQNIDPRLRRVFVSDPGMKMAYIDLEQAESRAVGAIEWNLFQNPDYLDACTSADLHTMVSKMCWENLPWSGDVKSDKAIAKQIFFRNLSYRDTAKRLGHGCVTPDHEVLTPSGWVKISEKPARIMAFSQKNKNFFADVAKWTEAFVDEDMYLFTGQFFDQLVTFNHRMVFAYNGAIFERAAEHVTEGLPLLAAQLKDEFLQSYRFNKANYEIKKIPYKGMVYCPTVPQTGMFLVRRNGKVSVTGNSNYGGKADNMSKETRIDLTLVKDFQYRYFKAFPAHREWHAWVRSKLLKDGFITTFMGRRRTFFGRRWDEDTVKEAIAYEPQSAVADYLNIGMLRVHQSKLCQLLLQVHDAILVQYPEEVENEVIPKLQKILEHEVPLMNGRTLIIPTEAKVGWNWGEAFDNNGKLVNANGLMSFTGKDDRKRVPEEDIFSRKFSLV